ncbi:HAD family acid phosphatase [Spiroplasma endosymbiont of Nephrotoma flavescens]|uniref:HAD family acid phosphatase n=1 Tax=Spiroplasma endosymbiont of Nephrotoma flavescens TaxID=3066302 RepID=UPI00313EB679
MKKVLKNMLLTIAPLTISANFLVSCNHTSKDNLTTIFNEYGALQSVLWAISAERKAQLLTQYRLKKDLYSQVIAKQKQVDKALTKGKLNNNLVKWEHNKLTINQTQENEFIPVVAVDLDETFIDNTPSSAYNLLNNKPFHPLEWDKWVNSQQATIFPGVLDFVQHVYKNGGLVMFVSNRLQDTHKETTRNNLIKENYPKELLQDFHWWMSGVKDSKQNIIKEKEDRYHYLNSNKLHIKEGIAVNIRIMMVLGDDINDFNSNFTNAKDNIYRNYYLEDNDV